MKRILHICNDDKFIPQGKRIFDAVPNSQSTYWVRPKKEKLEHIEFPCENIFNLDLNQKKYINQINQFDLLCIHFLHQDLYPLLNSKKITVPILWIGWGGDYYWAIDTHKDFNLFKPRTKKMVKKSSDLSLLSFVTKKIKKIKCKSNFEAINNIDYISLTFKEEYDLIKSNYSSLSPKYISWNYGYITQDVINQYEKFFCLDNKVLIGNSATSTNNHLDIFYDLNSILKEHKMVLPLNYGNSSYKNDISTFAKNTWGDNVTVLDKFIPLEEFNKILIQCRNVIIGSMRQQAVGTIITSMYMGANIFMYKDSINYLFFKNHGFHIFSIEDLKKNSNLLNTKLNQKQILENRNKINYLWSIEKNKDAISKLLEEL